MIRMPCGCSIGRNLLKETYVLLSDSFSDYSNHHHRMRQRSSGDFPTVLYEVINKRSSVVEGSLTIDDVNDYLDQIAQNMGKSYVDLAYLTYTSHSQSFH